MEEFKKITCDFMIASAILLAIMLIIVNKAI